MTDRIKLAEELEAELTLQELAQVKAKMQSARDEMNAAIQRVIDAELALIASAALKAGE